MVDVLFPCGCKAHVTTSGAINHIYRLCLEHFKKMVPGTNINVELAVTYLGGMPSRQRPRSEKQASLTEKSTK